MTLYAAAKGLDWVVFANERAASEPTMESNGHPVNHQFSKSLEFEDALRHIVEVELPARALVEEAQASACPAVNGFHF